MKKIKLYIAGKVSKNSTFASFDWRTDFCKRLSKRIECDVVNLDPVSTHSSFKLNEADSELIFGRDCFLIKSSDAVVVYLTNDISVGGSQEMLIAKYYKKPLIGLLPRESKFISDEKIIGKRSFKNWIHPFIKMTCDHIVRDEIELANLLKNNLSIITTKELGVIEQSQQYYLQNFYHEDTYINYHTSRHKVQVAQKGIITDGKRSRLLVVMFANKDNVRADLRGKFALPGGRVRYGEKPDASFKREIREETGIEMRPGKTFHNYHFNFHRNGVTHQIFAVVRHGIYETGNIQKPTIHDETDLESALWINNRELDTNQFVATEQPIIRSYLNAVNS